MSEEFYWVAVVAVTVISASRITRLATVDKFPPIKRVRDWYENRTEDTGWEWLTMCGYCFSFWATLPIIVWADLAGVFDVGVGSNFDTSLSAQAWWFVNGILAAAYLAAVFMANDGADGED